MRTLSVRRLFTARFRTMIKIYQIFGPKLIHHLCDVAVKNKKDKEVNYGK